MVAFALVLLLVVVVPVSIFNNKSSSSNHSTSTLNNSSVTVGSSPSSKEETDISSGSSDSLILQEGSTTSFFLPTFQDGVDVPSNSMEDDDDSVMASLLPLKTSTGGPSSFPTALSHRPSFTPTSSVSPSAFPSSHPSSFPSINDDFVPGLLTNMEHGLVLSKGLTARIIAHSGEAVPYQNTTYGDKSIVPFHALPDFGATFVDTRPSNPGGWVYVSNSEVKNAGGGVGAITFDPQGSILRFDQLLTGTTMNCGGGRTPWETWISCEETKGGQAYQVDPLQPGIKSFPITLGMDGGNFESFAFDVRNQEVPRFFITEDAPRGALQRFTPVNFATWGPEILHGPGTIDYLVLKPGSTKTGGTFSWSTSRSDGRNNAELYYPDSEGIDVQGSRLYFVCKNIKVLFELDLDNNTYTSQTTVNGLFDGGPDQLQRILVDGSEDYLFFTEEGGDDAGIHGRDGTGKFFTLLESPEYPDETSGLAFSPNGKHLYVAYQNTGILFDVSRLDGQPFHAQSMNVKYHASS